MKQKKPFSVLSILIVILFSAGVMLGSIDQEETGASLIVVAAAVFITVLLLQAKAKKQSSGHRSSLGRTAIPREAEDPRMKSFTKPDAPCIVCEHTGEDHLMRDKANRIKQLDDWLKSGLIDRSEYRVLKDRFERDL